MKYQLDVFFFFSSRRRHTRSKRDWSSDVCSSDLGRTFRCDRLSHTAMFGLLHQLSERFARQHRSEERRVGKECRSWWGWYDYKKKMRVISASHHPLRS